MRRTVVAGQFYPGDAETLRRQVEGYMAAAEVEVSETIKGAVVPHAGYIYSGKVAAHVYAALPDAKTFVIIGPNHHGAGSTVAVSSDTWSTPLGEVKVDNEIIAALPSSISRDETAHQYEHSIEVQLPFLQVRFNDFKIVPICMGMQDEKTAQDVSAALIEALKNKNATILASSDFTHYEPATVAHEKDRSVIEPILELDAHTFYSRLYQQRASVCGYGPIAVMIEATKALGAKRGCLLKYATCGDVTGDMSSVVGYAAISVGD